MESIIENDENKSINDEFKDFEDNNNNINKVDIFEIEDKEEEYEIESIEEDYDFKEEDNNNNYDYESDDNDNIYDDNSIVDKSIDISQMPNMVNEDDNPYFENSTSMLLFCWMQKHNICKYNFTTIIYIL
jgi:hypothetical protein